MKPQDEFGILFTFGFVIFMLLTIGSLASMNELEPNVIDISDYLAKQVNIEIKEFIPAKNQKNISEVDYYLVVQTDSDIAIWHYDSVAIVFKNGSYLITDVSLCSKNKICDFLLNDENKLITHCSDFSKIIAVKKISDTDYDIVRCINDIDLPIKFGKQN